MKGQRQVRDAVWLNVMNCTYNKIGSYYNPQFLIKLKKNMNSYWSDPMMNFPNENSLPGSNPFKKYLKLVLFWVVDIIECGPNDNSYRHAVRMTKHVSPRTICK